MTYRLREQWADATRFGQCEEADRLWKLLLTEVFGKPRTAPDQPYWNDLLRRRMEALARKEHRNSISDEEFDNFYGDIHQ